MIHSKAGGPARERLVATWPNNAPNGVIGRAVSVTGPDVSASYFDPRPRDRRP